MTMSKMKLHDAIVKVIEHKGTPMTTSEIADELNINKWYQKKDGSDITAFQIHGRTNNYEHLFKRNGTTVSLIKVSTNQKSIRPPKWHRDEIILALQLYHSLEAREMDSNNLKIIEVSEILNKLPIHTSRKEHINFRNPNGVAMKLNNFKAIDPNYEGKGMDRYSRLDKEVFFEFQDNISGLNKLAERIKSAISDEELSNKLYSIGEEEDDESHEVREGKVIYKLHKLRERDSKINKKKKEVYLRKYGKLDCEVCGFDFYEIYGKIGKGFIEAHHRIPLSDLDGESTTKLNDLALVCSNCHRMLHREIDSLSITELSKLVKRDI